MFYIVDLAPNNPTLNPDFRRNCVALPIKSTIAKNPNIGMNKAMQYIIALRTPLRACASLVVVTQL